MMYPYIMNNSSLTVIIDGKSHTINDKHVSYTKIKEAIKNNDEDSVKKLIDIPTAINTFGQGLVSIKDGVVSYKGKELHNSLTRRMLAMFSEGFDVNPLVKFLENVMLNPSNRAVTELYGFLEKNNLPITDNGTFLAYKKVRQDWKDVYTGTINNSIGAVVEMVRNEVDDTCTRTCSTGLHFCSLEYLPHYSSDPVSGDSRVVIVEINPADVVSIPVDYNNSKGRCCKYKVVDDVTTQTIDYLNKSYVPTNQDDDDCDNDEYGSDSSGFSGEYNIDDEDYDLDDEDNELTQEEELRLDFLEDLSVLISEHMFTDGLSQTIPGMPEITELTTPDDLGIDSLDAVELVMAIEEEFGVEVTDSTYESWRNVGDIVDFLVANENKPAPWEVSEEPEYKPEPLANSIPTYDLAVPRSKYVEETEYDDDYGEDPVV